MDALQDLSLEDAEELRAFAEKRIWFESRLQILESSPTIYPFLHPILILNPDPGPSSRPYIRLAESESSWKTPTAEQVAIWQKERDMMEEEVLSFDGGDLVRMKKKTRAATLHPLTPPSTHLVSITLSLIVLIDRLLTLLRHRGELLEVTSLRLRWDDMRWAVQVELEIVVAEAHSIALTEGRWGPQKASHINIPATPLKMTTPRIPNSRSDKAISSTLSDRLASPVAISRSTTLPSLASIATGPPRTPQQPHTPLSPHTPIKYLYSPSNRNTPSKRNLQLPLLHSHITNLEIRHRNLTMNQLARTGALLDKMIDHAGPLKDLGGVDGPGTGAEGAVPDTLLDLQDDLENDVKMSETRLTLCRDLEEQWRLSESYYQSLSQARKLAEDVLAEINSALSRPATGIHLQYLFGLVQSAQKQSPLSSLSHITRPSHPDFGDLEDHNDSVSRTLETGYAQTSQLIQECEAGCTWYGKLASTTGALLIAQGHVTQLERKLRDCLMSLNGSEEDGTEGQRPSLDSIDCLNRDHSQWLEKIPGAITMACESNQSTSGIAQRARLAIMQQRQAIRSIPVSVKSDHSPFAVSEVDSVELDVDNLLELSQDVSRFTEAVQLELKIIPLANDVKTAASGATAALRQAEGDILESIDNISDGRPCTDERSAEYASGYKEINHSVQTEILQGFEQLQLLLTSYSHPASAIAAHFVELIAGLKSEQARLYGVLDFHGRIMEQVKIVAVVEREAVSLLIRLEEVQSEAKDIGLGDVKREERLTGNVNVLKSDIKEWEAALSGRVMFVGEPAESALNGSSRGREASHGSLANRSQFRAANISASDLPLTPPVSPPILHKDDLSNKLAILDTRTREAINNHSARVSTALAHLEQTAAMIPYTRWVRQRDAKTIALQTVNEEWPALKASIERGLPARTMTALRTGDGSVTVLLDLQQRLLSDGDIYAERLRGAKSDLQSCLAESPNVDPKLLHIADDDPLDEAASQIGLAEAIEAELAGLQAEISRHMTELERKEAVRRVQAVPAEEKVVEGGVLNMDGRPYTRSSATSLETLSSNIDIQDEARLAIEHLTSQVDSLHSRLKSLTEPTATAAHSTPRSQRLPFAIIVEDLQTQLSVEEAACGNLRRRADQRDDHILDDLQSTILSSRQLLHRLDHLVAFSDSCADSDTALSELLVKLDSRQSSSESASQVAAAVSSGSSSMKRTRQAAEAVSDDPRVDDEVKRLDATWTELQGMIAGSRAITPITELGSDDGHSETASTSISTAPTPRDTPTSRIPLSVSRSSIRSISGPFYTPSLVDSSRVRAVSDTPSRTRMDSLRSGSGLPRPRKESLTLGRSAGISLSSLASPSVGISRSEVPVQTGQGTPRTRRISRLPPIPKKTYVADPKSRLDMAVGRIVNNLDVDIPVVPVGASSGEEWKDQSGKYWIGAEGRAKLCFCRILRSKMVMVRVGGGWIELSKFLLDHFADAYHSWSSSNPPVSDLGLVIGSATPIRITSASVHPTTTPARSHTPRQSSITLPFITPTRHSLPLPNTSNNPPVTPVRSNPSSMSPSNAITSPLLPLQFIRKASESPPVREKEKERIRAGRRSILGKEGLQPVSLQQ